jgi:repressor LexA
MTARGLSWRQATLLAFIDGYIRQNSWAPSIREMCAGIGVASTSSVAYQLGVLEDLGHIERQGDTPRALRVTKQGTAIARRGKVATR